MAYIPNFHSLTKDQENLLNKNYCFATQGLLNVNISKGDFKFHSRIWQRKGQDLTASTWASISTDYASLKHKRSTEKFSQYKLEITPIQYIEGLKLTCDCKLWGGSGEHKDPSVSLEYQHKQASGKVAYHTETSDVILQVTTGKVECGVGAEVKCNVARTALEEFTTAVWWNKLDSSLVLKHATKAFELGSVNISYYQELNSNTRMGSNVNTNLKSASTEIEVGGDYQMDEDTLMKAKVNSTGTVGLAFVRQLTKSLKGTFASEINTKSLVSHSDSEYKLGFRFDFNN